jgi:ABC-type transport system substrate-binding protein
VVSDIVVLDPHRIEFRLSESRPRAFMLGAFASGWNIIVRKKTLEEHVGNLRSVPAYPGTGPFRHVSRKDKEVWIMERNPDYWNKVNTKKPPLGDPRVRRAMHLALDRHALIDVLKDVAPMMVGGFLYPFHDMSTPREELFKRPGYQRDTKAAVQEAKRLMAEAGYAGGIKNLTFLVRDIISFKHWSVAIQAMLRETLNIATNLRTVQIAHNRVRGQNPSTFFGIYDVVRWDTVSIAS